MNETIVYLIVPEKIVTRVSMPYRRDKAWRVSHFADELREAQAKFFLLLIDNWLNSFLVDDQNRKDTLVENCKIATLITYYFALLQAKYAVYWSSLASEIPSK